MDELSKLTMGFEVDSKPTPEVAMSPRRNPTEEAIRDPLPGLREQLTSEFGGVVPREKIDQAAERALGELEGASIREFVSVFAWRRARARLRRPS